MTKNLKKHDAAEDAERSPAIEGEDAALDAKAREAEEQLKRAEAALRGQPEDRREAARQTTPPGKARSQ